MNLEQLLQAIYDTENNVSITCFWDGGWDVGLGDRTNGFKAQGNVDRVEQIAPWLAAEVQKHLPEAAAVIKAYRVCCYIDPVHGQCHKPAQWLVVDGPADYNVTDSCTEHVGVMLSDAGETTVLPIR